MKQKIVFYPLFQKRNVGFHQKNFIDIFNCIVHKLKTGCQWKELFIDIESVKYPFSWQLVYYYYRKWCKLDVFQEMFEAFLSAQKDKINQENLNLDGIQSLVKNMLKVLVIKFGKKEKPRMF